MVKYQKQKSIWSRYHNFKFGDKITEETYIIINFWDKIQQRKKSEKKTDFVPLFFQFANDNVSL